MPSWRVLSALAAITAVAGCVYLPLGKVSPINGMAASIRVKTEFGTGNYRTQTSGDLLPYAQSDVQHIVLKLYASLGVGNESASLAEKDIPAASLSEQVSFFNLHPNTTYRIKAFAYKASGVATDDLISVQASATVDVPVLTDERPTAANLKVQLKDRPFQAQGTSSIVVTNGSLTNIDEVIETPTPAP